MSAASSNQQTDEQPTARHRTFTRAEVAEHCEMDDAWVTCGGYVHDVTPFMDQHPGGAKLLKPYLGRDVEEGMEKLGHSSYSYGLLKEYIIGVIEGAELRQHYQPNPKSLRGYDPQVLDKAVDFTKPTVWQVLKMGDKYWPWIESRPFVNNPMAQGGLILFENRVMEALSRYPWWYIWVMWPPLCAWQLYHGFFQSAAATHLTQVAAAAASALSAGDVVAAATATTSSFLYSNVTAQTMAAGVASAPWFPRAVLESAADSLTLATMPQALIRVTIWNLTTTFLLGMFTWTIFEYFFHRCVFHLESHGNFGNTFHYFMHGIHHLTPTDSTRLTFPALFVSVLAYGVHVLMRESIPLVAKASTCPFQAVFAGFLFAYTLYDTAHFFFHHSDFNNSLFRRLKTAHLNHHYKNEEMNFGVTSPLWDHVFGTWDPQTGKDRAGSGKARASSKKAQ